MNKRTSDRASVNAEILMRLMNEPKSGSLMQAFIMVAIEEYAERVIELGPDCVENPVIPPQDWIACANEARDAMRIWEV